MTEPAPRPEEPTPVDGTAVPHAVRGVGKWLWTSVLLLWGAVAVIAWGTVSGREAFNSLGLFMFMAGLVTTLITYLFVLIEPGLFQVRKIKVPLIITFAGFVFLALISLLLSQLGSIRMVPLVIHLLGMIAAIVLLTISLRRNARGLFVAALIVLFLASIPW